MPERITQWACGPDNELRLRLHDIECVAQTPTVASFEVPAQAARAAAPGIRMRDLFDSAKAAMRMPLDEVESLFASPLYEVRIGAFCLLDFRAKAPRTGETQRKRLYGLSLGHHDCITTRDTVDCATPSDVGGYLMRLSSAPLHALAAAQDPLR